MNISKVETQRWENSSFIYQLLLSGEDLERDREIYCFVLVYDVLIKLPMKALAWWFIAFIRNMICISASNPLLRNNLFMPINGYMEVLANTIIVEY